MEKKVIPKLNIDTIMQKLRDENKQSQVVETASAVAVESQLKLNLNLDISLLAPLEKLKKVDTVFPNNNRYHINDFCVHHDELFITNIFKGLLKRKPDAEEMNHYLLLARQGQLSKKEIVAKIRFSKEGRKRGITVKGLKIPYTVMLIGKIPLIGFIFKIIMAIIRLPLLINQIRQLEAHSQIPEIKVEQLAEILEVKLKNALEDRLQINLEEKLNSLHLAIAQKAERSELVNKVERSELDAKAERSELASKVNRTELEEKVDYISLTSLLEAKVDYPALYKELELRVDYGSLEINLATKANQTEMIKALEKINANKCRLDEHKTTFSDHKINLIDNQRRLNLLLEEARKRLPEPFSVEQLTTIAKEEDHIFDAMYVAFEDKFRGTRNDIQQRQKVYLPTLEAALNATNKSLVLDMGCGRGEWLELLQNQNIRAEGVDLNCIMIRECEQRGLQATEADILDYLRPLQDSSIGAVTGFHIIEHLPFKVLIAFFDECLRVLKPGGTIIFETPNPENLLVGGCNFYTDPSHHNPLVPETMRFTIEQRGFEKTEIKRLHKYSDFYETTSDDEFIKAHFYNEMDYAIIGHKV
ncbi:MAG: methyltransferase domain-containing protein [Methylococcales bacterium]|nr:methyltransferase domain-containing protein [Methylococcales bacterium]